MKSMTPQHDGFFNRVSDEFKRQREKYGEAFCESLSPETWALILAEETGEVADAVLKLMRQYLHNKENPDYYVSPAQTECVHVAATALSTFIALEQYGKSLKSTNANLPRAVQRIKDRLKFLTSTLFPEWQRADTAREIEDVQSILARLGVKHER